MILAFVVQNICKVQTSNKMGGILSTEDGEPNMEHNFLPSTVPLQPTNLCIKVRGTLENVTVHLWGCSVRRELRKFPLPPLTYLLEAMTDQSPAHYSRLKN